MYKITNYTKKQAKKLNVEVKPSNTKDKRLKILIDNFISGVEKLIAIENEFKEVSNCSKIVDVKFICNHKLPDYSPCVLVKCSKCGDFMDINDI